MDNYAYFVSYTMPEHFGRCEVCLPEPVISIGQVEEMESIIAGQMNVEPEKVVVLFYQFLCERHG